MGLTYRADKNRKRDRSVAMTTAEYFRTGESVLPRELVYGALRVAESPTVHHQRVVRDITIGLHAHVRPRMLGEVLPAPMDVILDYDAGLVVQPDILYIEASRAGIVEDCVTAAPDLVVEVLSPHPRIGEINERVGWFAGYGVRECWLVDLPKRTIAVLTFEDGKTVAHEMATRGQRIPSRVLPGLMLTPDDVFGYAVG